MEYQELNGTSVRVVRGIRTLRFWFVGADGQIRCVEFSCVECHLESKVSNTGNLSHCTRKLVFDNRLFFVWIVFLCPKIRYVK